MSESLIARFSFLGYKRGKRPRFAVGHLASGYILGKSTARLLKTHVSIPVVLALSIVPDADLLLDPILPHRGPTHSMIMTAILFLPFLFIYRKQAVPYLTATVQHALVGDLIGGSGTQLLWPITTEGYGATLEITGLTNIALESSFFLAATIIMLKTNDIAGFFKPNLTNLVLAVPTFTVLLPTFLSFPLRVPVLLIPSHLVYMVIFSTSIAITSANALGRCLST